MTSRHYLPLLLALLGVFGLLPARAGVYLRDLPDTLVIRATGPHGYTAIIDRADGHLRSLTAGLGETFADQPIPREIPRDAKLWLGFHPTQVGLMGVLTGEKVLVARGVPAVQQPNQREHGALVIAFAVTEERTLTYTCEPERLGISITGKSADLILRWSRKELVYTLPTRTVFGHLDTYSGESMPTTVTVPHGRAVLGITPPLGSMALSDYARLPLTDTPLWLSPRPATAEDELPFLRLATFFVHDTDEGTFWTPHPQDYALVDSLRLLPGRPLVARLQSFGARVIAARYKAPHVVAYALNITNGDPQLLREGRHQWPGMYPTLAPVNWRPLPTKLAAGVITADTHDLPPGSYRIRLAAADDETPSPTLGLYADDIYLVIADTLHSFDLYTTQNRTVYYRGEVIPVTLLARTTGMLPAGTARLTLLRGNAPVGPASAVSIPTLQAETRRLACQVATRDLAPGFYALFAEYTGIRATKTFEIVDPEGPSVIAISENQIPGSPFSNTLLGTPFGGKPVDSLAHGLAAPYADLQVTTIRNELSQGYAARVNQRLADTLAALNSGPAAERIGRYDLRQLWMDGLTRLRIGYWQGIQGRALSFSKANTLPGTEDEIRRRLLATARDYRDYANFFGPQVDVDCGSVNANDQLGYAGIPDAGVQAFRARLGQAQEAAFQAACANEIAAAGKDQTAIAHLRSAWYRGVWARADAGDQAALALLDPTLQRTANREYHHGSTSSGQYAPALYRGMDVHHVEAWGDAMDNVLFADAWANLGAAARRAGGRPDQPLWIETQAYHGDVPGCMQARWWGVLANGGDGIGYAANVFGLRQYSGIEPHQASYQRQTAAAMANLVRTLGPALRASERERRVALLFSKTEADWKGYNYNVHCFGNQPPFVSFFALAMAGYQPDYLFEEQILAGELDRYRVLYLTWQEHTLPAAVQAKIDAFVAKGGTVVIDAVSKADLFPKAVRCDVNPLQYKGPHAFGGPEDWAWIDANVPKLRAILDPLALLPGRAEHPRCVTYWLAQGKTQYALVINEGYAPLRTTLVLKQPLGGYDLFTGERFAPTVKVPVDLRNLGARLYAFTPTPVTGIAMKATARAIAGTPVGITASLLTTGNKPLDAVAPATLRITARDGRVRWERWQPIGAGQPPAVWVPAATEPAGTYTVTITELLSGKTATFSLTLTAGKMPAAITRDTSPIAIAPEDARALGTLWNTKGDWSIILADAQPHRLQQATNLAETLRKRGLRVSLWEMPVTVRMPVGYLFTPEEQAVRDRVFAGEVIGDRYYLHGWDGDKSAPYAETWEPRDGPAIYRNVIIFGQPGESPLLDQYGPEPAPGGAISVGLRQFAGDDDAVFLTGQTDEELARAIAVALACKPTAARLGPEAGREALQRGYLLRRAAKTIPPMTAVPVKAGEAPITWEETLGRPIMQIHVSPNGRHILVKHHGYTPIDGQYAPDGTPERTLVRAVVGDTGDDDVRGVDDTGALLLTDEKGARRTLALDGTLGPAGPPPPLWHNADDTQTLIYEPYTVEEQDKDGKPVTTTKQRLVRRHGAETVFTSETLGQVPGGLQPSPHGKYLLQSENGAQRSAHIGQHGMLMHDGLTGKLLWEKKGWWVFTTAWSRDGEYLAVVRHYNNVDRHGIWPETWGRCTISFVRAADGEVVAEDAPTTWPGRLQIAADNSFVVAYPAYLADHYWLLMPGKPLQKVIASRRWLYTATLDGAGRQVITLDLDGTLRRHQPTGEVLWTSNTLHRPPNPVLGLLQPYGEDFLLGSTTGTLYRLSGKDGSVLWQKTTADLLEK